MSAIEAIRQNPKATSIVVAGVVLAVAAYAFLSMKRDGDTIQTESAKVYFTTDDGATWFADAAEKVPPFEKDGKEAVRIHLFDAGAGKPPTVGFLERVSPDARAKIQALQGKQNAAYQISELKDNGIEVKRKGDTKWTAGNTPDAGKIRQPPMLPDKSGEAAEVGP